ncbi:hypothetical protein PAXRUDRAFT_21625 [Paxillus rubicundulus Ve08.2h10]|uniref:Uncharacterized protein n=1 Tax=Paxillus rubicundulus Ve08.2h10 TaxID=930991 RepID=A0A0D0BM37_9AGAM|nr:hypothetical protein PAXRUDRAFT_21625 [Paxillus rubicundulus Ve08.2h10]
MGSEQGDGRTDPGGDEGGRETCQRVKESKASGRGTSQKGEKYLKEFAEEMWRQCRMRVAVLTAWKDGSGQTMTTQYDINDQIEDGEAFDGWGGTHQRWMEYAKKALGDPASYEEESPTDTDSNLDSSPVERKKQAKKGKKAKVDAVSMVSHIRKEWIGDIKDASLDVMKHMVRGFITFYYNMGKQARGRGLDDEGSEEDEADGRRWTRSEAVSNHKDSGMQQARNKVREKKSNGKDGRGE